MNEQAPGQNANVTQDDINAAHELARKADSFESERGAILGATALMNEAYVTLLGNDESAYAQSVNELASTSKTEVNPHALPSHPVHESARIATELVDGARDDTRTQLTNAEHAWERSTSDGEERIQSLNESIKHVYETGETPEQTARKERAAQKLAKMRDRTNNGVQLV